MKNPYTLIFGMEPLQSIPRLTQVNEIVSSIVSEPFTPNIYMVTGLRGSGKTVFMTEIGNKVRREKEWLVVELNSSSELMTDLAAALASENHLARLFQSAKINLSLFGIGLEVEGSVAISNIQVALTKMLTVLKKNNKKVLVLIDEVTPSDEMKVFAGAFQIFVRQNLPISLIMTGLHKSIDLLQNTKNLTFLYRAPKIVLSPLNLGRIAENYRSIIGVSHDDSLQMAALTKGYSFAFQVLGYYTWEAEGKDFRKAIPNVRAYLEECVYEKIWSELSAGDKKFIEGIVMSSEGKASEIIRFLKTDNSSYSVYRSRLIKSGIITASDYGKVKITLPFFEDFVKTNLFFDDI